MAGKAKGSGERALPQDENADRDPLLVEVGLKILNARRRAGLIQTELADKAGVTHSTVFMTESGKQNITLKTLRDLANALGVRVRDLMPGEDTPETVTPESLKQVADTLLTTLGRATLLVQQAEGLTRLLSAAPPPDQGRRN